MSANGAVTASNIEIPCQYFNAAEHKIKIIEFEKDINVLSNG